MPMTFEEVRPPAACGPSEVSPAAPAMPVPVLPAASLSPGGSPPVPAGAFPVKVRPLTEEESAEGSSEGTGPPRCVSMYQAPPPHSASRTMMIVTGAAEDFFRALISSFRGGCCVIYELLAAAERGETCRSLKKLQTISTPFPFSCEAPQE